MRAPNGSMTGTTGRANREATKDSVHALRSFTRKAIEFLTDFRDRAVLAAARDHKADGVICGHIHRSDHRLIGNVLYVNDGDWVHNRTAVVEEQYGTLQVLRWSPSPQNISVSEPMPQEATS